MLSVKRCWSSTSFPSPGSYVHGQAVEKSFLLGFIVLHAWCYWHLLAAHSVPGTWQWFAYLVSTFNSFSIFKVFAAAPSGANTEAAIFFFLPQESLLFWQLDLNWWANLLCLIFCSQIMAHSTWQKNTWGFLVYQEMFIYTVCVKPKKGFFHHGKQHMGFTLQQVCSTALETAVESFSSLTASSLYGKYRLGLVFSMWNSLQILVCSNF